MYEATKVLLAERQAVVSYIRWDEDVVSVFGNIYTSVTYQRDIDDLDCIIVDTPFEEEILAKGVDKSCLATAVARVKNTRLHTELSESEKINGFTLEMQTEVSTSVCCEKTLGVVTDAFSHEYETDVYSSAYDCISSQKYTTHFCKVDGSIDAEEVEEVLCVTNARAIVVGCTPVDDKVSIEGLLTGTVIYGYDDKMSSLPFDIPFVTLASQACNFACEVANTAIAKISARKTRGSINIEAGLKFGINYFDSKKVRAVDNVVLLEPRQNDCAIEVLVGKKGMTEWDMQKYLGMSKEDIYACNPGITLPLKEDKNVIIYRKID